MGGGHSRGRGRGPPPLIDITIPDFPFPPVILSYIMSQSGKYKITLTPPGSSKTIELESPPAAETPDPPEEPPTWVDTELQYLFDIPADTDDAAASSSVARIKKSANPAITKKPAYSHPTTPPIVPSTVEATLAPTLAPNTFPRFRNTGMFRTLDINTPAPTGIQLPDNIPIFWKSAIYSMEFIGGLNLPITTKEQMYTLYRTLQTQITKLMGDGTNNENNIAALIYFCTVIEFSFESFNQALAYNYLNGRFPEIFPDSKAYRNLCMINNYSIYAKVLFDKNPILGKHVDINDRTIRYFVPPILNSVLAILQQALTQ